MHRILVVFILTSIIQLESCCNSEKVASSDRVQHEINISSAYPRQIEDIFQPVRLVPLETREGSYIQELSKLLSVGDTLIVADFKLATVFLFDSGGKYLRRMTRLGKGPEEYVSLSDISYDPVKKELVIMDVVGRKMIKYDLNFNCKGYTRLSSENAGYQFELIGKGYLFYREYGKFPTVSQYNITLTDTSGEQEIVAVASVIPEPFSGGRRFTDVKCIDVQDGTGYIIPLHNDTLFVASSKSIKPFCKINIPKQDDIKASNAWQDDEAFEDSGLMQEMLTGKKLYGFDHLVVNRGLILLRYLLAHTTYLLVYDLKNSVAYKVQSPSICRARLGIEPIGKMGEEFIFKPQNNNMMTSILNRHSGLSLTEGHNPVLVFAKPK